jgi:hypothetical protein
MYYGLVYYPKIDTNRINQIRRKYDPTFGLIAPHLAVLFPVPDDVSEEALVQHIESVLTSWKPFPIHIQGFCKSWDHWLFLTLQEGNDDVIKLNKAIYTRLLEPYRRNDIEFIPHISLGLFVMESADYDLKDPHQLEFDAEKYEAALREAEVLGLEYKCLLDRLCLVKLRDDFSRLERGREFHLSGMG